MYQAVVVKCGIAPSEYWQMTPRECWLIIEANTPEQTYGNLKRSEVDEMIAFRDKLESQGYELA